MTLDSKCRLNMDLTLSLVIDARSRVLAVKGSLRRAHRAPLTAPVARLDHLVTSERVRV
jgi:hypothetical protein